ncbi:MAG: DNA primase, partial [Promethearchaeota archaeon]
IKNAVACQGTSIPNSLAKLVKGKEITVLLDGDRGGDIILEALLQTLNVDYIARAPRGKEIEELTPKHVLKVLSEKISTKKLKEDRKKVAKKTIGVPKTVMAIASDLKGTLEAVILDEKLEQIERVPVSELAVKLRQVEGAHMVIFDGIITQRIVDIATEQDLKTIVGERISGLAKRPTSVELLTIDGIVAKEA